MAKKKLVITIRKGVSSPSVPELPTGPPVEMKPEKKPQAQVSLKIRKTLDGNYIVSDHTDVSVGSLEVAWNLVSPLDACGHSSQAWEEESKHLVEPETSLR